MSAIRRRDTKPERAVRSLLHAAGLRYRVDLPVVVDGVRIRRPETTLPCCETPGSGGACFGSANSAALRRAAAANGKFALE